jgi:hypothetical protein
MIEIAGLLEGALHMPLTHGTMSEKDMLKMYNLITLIAYGKRNVPYIAYFQANDERTELVDVGLIHDVYLHPEQQTELIRNATFLQMDNSPSNYVALVRELTKNTLMRDVSRIIPGVGLAVVHRDEYNDCVPGVFAIAGAHNGVGLVMGNLVQSNHQPLITAQGLIAARNAKY